MIETGDAYVPDRWVAGWSFTLGVLSMLLIPDPESDVRSISIGLGLSGIIDFGVWRSRGWAFAMNVLLGSIGILLYYFEGVPQPLSWPLEILPLVVLVVYSLLRLTERVGPPTTGWRPYAPLGGRIDHRETQ